MSHLKHTPHLKTKSDGFTIVELMVVILITGIISTAFYTFFNTFLNRYLTLQQDSLAFSDITYQSQRVAQVVRGLTDITQASSSELTMYAYFYPKDTYVSLVHYYKNTGGTALLVDITSMTANPPIGTPITNSMRTYTIIPDFKTVSGVNLFDYLDSAGGALPSPVADLHTIKGVKINLSVSAKADSSSGNTSISLQVSLRNRKTNL